MFSIIFTQEALENIQHIRAYTAKENESAAQEVTEKIYETCRFLKLFPEIGRAVFARPGVRVYACAGLPYIIAYRLRNDTIEVLSVFHGAQNITR